MRSTHYEDALKYSGVAPLTQILTNMKPSKKPVFQWWNQPFRSNEMSANETSARLNESRKKIYIAGPYDQKETARLLARALDAAGHHILSFWHEQVDPVPEFLHNTLALEDKKRVEQSNLLIAFNIDDSSTGATHQEIGIANGRDIPVCVLGEQESVNLLARTFGRFFSLKPKQDEYAEAAYSVMEARISYYRTKLYNQQEELEREREESNNYMSTLQHDLAEARGQLNNVKARLALVKKQRPTAKKRSTR